MNGQRVYAAIVAHPVLAAVLVWAVADLIAGVVIERRRTAAIVAETRAQLEANAPAVMARMQYAADGENDLGHGDASDG